MNPRPQDQGVARGALVLHRAARPVHLIEPAGEVEHGGPRPVVPAGEVAPSPTRYPRVGGASTRNTREPCPGAAAARASAGTAARRLPPVSTPRPRRRSVGPAMPSRRRRSGAMLSQVQSSQEPSHTPPEYQKFSGVEKVIAGTIASRTAGPRPRRATAPRRDTTARRCPTRRSTRAGARPTRWCRSRRGPPASTGRTRRRTRSGPGRPAARRRIRGAPRPAPAGRWAFGPALGRPMHQHRESSVGRGR